MSQKSDAEEFDPATGKFRPIARKGAMQPAPLNPSPRMKNARPAAYKVRSRPNPADRAPGTSGLSESGERFGVFYEIFEHAARSPAGNVAHKVSLVVIAIVFVLLMYEAIAYRISQGG